MPELKKKPAKKSEPELPTAGPEIGLSITSFLNKDPRRVKSLKCLIYSLEAQFYTNWSAVIIHDGPVEDHVRGELGFLEEVRERVQLIEPEERLGDFGHPYRKLGLSMLNPRCQYVGMTNDDNYYAPTYFQFMLHALQQEKVSLALCSMVHSHRGWREISANPRRGSVDAGSWIADRDLALETPWEDFSFAGDWFYFKAMLDRVEGRVAVLPELLFVHN